MNTDRLDPFYDIIGVTLPIPTSFGALPELPRLNKEQFELAAELERSFTQESGILPGTYTKFDDVKALINVHDRLWDNLESELLKWDNLAICKLLYKKFEVILGHLYMNKYRTAADQVLTGRTQGSAKRIGIWLAITPLTEGIKFLLEMAIKCCRDQGLTSGGSRLDFLIGLSISIVMLDALLDNIHYQIIPYEITIDPNFSIYGGITNQARVAIDNFKKYEETHMAQADRDFIDNLSRVMGPEIKVDDFRAIPGIVPLDKAMTEELGYGIFDWLNYSKGCLSLFGEKEFLKLIGVPRLTRHLRDMVGLNSEKIELILQDHALSQATVKDLSRDDMMPFANYKRDSRLLRRPLLEINHGGARIVIMGIETFIIGGQVFSDSLSYGTLQIPRMQPEGPVKSAMGRLQAKLGDPFRESIVSKCIEMGFKAEKEWPLPKKDKTDKPVGPIDILVIDQKKRRFILVEAKNLQSQGIIPKEMKGQRDRFLGEKEQDDQAFIRVLKDKEQTFASNKEWHLHELKHKLRMDGLENYSVESVIVVFHPLFWPLFATEPLPILDDLEFYKRLRLGQSFLAKTLENNSHA